MSPEPNERALRQRGRGISLIETLIGALIFAFVTTGAYLLYTTMQNTMTRGELMSDLQQNARIGLAQMAQEIRMTGYDPSGVIPLVALAPKAPVRAAMPGCFSFVADVKGSGTAGQLTYYMRGTTLYRKWDNWNGINAFNDQSPQPLVGSVNWLSFTYYDANNRVLLATAWTSTQRCPPDAGAGAQSNVQLTFDQMRLIRRVGITLKTQGSRPGVFPEFFSVTSDVRLRNL
jgi:type II secretory pathway component PulJ